MNVVWIWLDYCSGYNMDRNYVISFNSQVFLHADYVQRMKKYRGQLEDEPDIKKHPR